VADTVVTACPIGRRRQFEVARRWIDELSAGRGRAALVEGEPGIGKSSLVRATAAEAEAAGCQVFWGNCDELSQAFPLLPLLEALDGRIGDCERIADLLRTEAVPGNGLDTVHAAVERMLVLLDELCTKAPVVLVVDDLQWADPATVVTLARLARSVHQLPLLLIGINRPVPRREDLSALRRSLDPDDLVALESLSDDDVADLVASVVDGTPGTRLLGLAADAGGNPFYITELVDALARGRILTIRDGHVDADSGPIPDSLAAAIADRLEFLSAPTREIIRAGALLGLDFSVSELAMACGRRINDLLPLLDEAILAGVVVDQGLHLAFRHPLIRASLYEGMPGAVRAAWHRDVARALAENGAAAERVARQLLPALEAAEGTEPVDDWVVRWLAEAGQHLVGQAPQVAIPLLRWAVAGVPAGVVPHDALACRLADALYRVGDPAGAAEVANGALSYTTRADYLVELHWTLAQCRSFAGRSEQSLDALRRAVDAPGVGPRHRARLLVLTARTYRSLGRIEDASRTTRAALEAATAADDRWAMAWALGGLTIMYGSRGEPERALPLFDQALAASEGDPALADLRLLLQTNKAVALGDLDRYDDAIDTAMQARQRADDAGNVVRLAQAQSALGELLFDVGRWDDALAEVDGVFGVTEDPAVECTDHGLAATIQLHRGDSGARRHLVAAQQFAARLGERIAGPLVLARSLDREQTAGPAAALATLLDFLSEPKEVEETGDLLADAVRLAVTVGDVGTAADLVQQAEAAAEGSAVPHREAIAAHCRGLLDHDPVPLLRAADRYGDAGRPLPRAQALEAAGLALAELGDVVAARSRFEDAFTVYESLGAGWDLARSQAQFRGYGIRRGPHVRHRKPDHGWSSLTPTEQKIIPLVARGMSNPQIAAQLFLSRRTVQTHVSHILAKLNLASRIDIAREASKRAASAHN
jgi:DNA-binding CsgD family transcriptional regulator/tetratricopeptide (TPR) repeat protein